MPPHLAELGTEAPVYLPPCFMAAMPGRASAKGLTRGAVGLPGDGIVFANFNHPWKFEPRGFKAWMAILRAVPNSVFWVANWHDAAMANLRAAVDAAGLDARRLVVAPTAAHDDHLERLALADLALDPFYVAGGVTTFDALRAGLPVIAHGGAADTPSARMGASIVGAAGLGELVAGNDERYVELAIALGRDRDRRQALRAEIPVRAARALDLEVSARAIERAYRAIWSRFEQGLAPTRIEV
jgi:predicted O-linked N-acetylglucosamine transferase (SPINDLY family)